MLTSELDRLVMLMEEIQILRSRLQPEDTGYIHTTINTLEERVKEIKSKLDNGSKGFRNN